MYNEDKITIKSKDDIGIEIKILGGVKQGDPLSPLLFNLCLEPLLEMIGEQTSEINVSQTRKVPVLAFADDIVLLVEDDKEAQRQVDTFHEYLKGLGMTISRDESQTLQVVANRDTRFI
jgi:hypothetical protein